MSTVTPNVEETSAMNFAYTIECLSSELLHSHSHLSINIAHALTRGVRWESCEPEPADASEGGRASGERWEPP